MKAAVVRQLGAPLVVEEVPIPVPGPFEALVQVDYSGVCHTDLHAARGDWPVKPVPPFIPGHEGSGRVVELGPSAAGVRVGDRIGNAWLATACGVCRDCLGGWESLCTRQQNSGYSVDGSFAEYMVVDTRYAPRIPEGADAAGITAVLCAGVTVYKGLKVTGARPGDWVVVSGIGGLGHMAIQYAAAMGFRVIAVTGTEAKRQRALDYGAELVVNYRDGDPGEAVQDLVGGAQAALVTAVSEKTFPQALSMLRRGGTVSLVGLPPGDFPLSIFDTVLRGLTVRGSIVGTRLDMLEAVDFFSRGVVSTTFERQPMDAINDIFTRMATGVIDGRVVLDMSL
ncbi:zinc-dependent alcohol dehydrogenase [Sanguibacter sp. 4.1]|uniref:Alcohol dehydrogenase n=1 Tax=Sanguibacter biliveldensis TaxID=3030830 RepID=A0AAF1C5E6_9MICO|nr:zinc-dependent alcohol dehydrogenase [Sanguibacter sp. 4.1]WPF84258.1 zinc-dependent alcohol dehydrogenase [Sanguibacter sp. 4.1]